MPAIRTAFTSIIAMSSVLLSSTFAYAAPAVFFNANTATGLDTFNQTIANADAAYNAANPGSTRTTTVYEFNFATANSTRGNFDTSSAAASAYTVTATSSSTYTTASVASPATIYFTVAAPSTGTRTEAGNLYASWSVNAATWAEHVSEGYTVDFFSDSTRSTPVEFNAISVMTDDWGTCCTGTNDTPTGSAAGSAIYYQFTNNSSTETLFVGNITSSISSTDHFTAAINDTNTWSNIRLIPNGDGEAFGAGGILRFASVAINSVPSGSSSVVGISSSSTRDITLSTDVDSDLGTTLNYVFDGGTLTLSGNLTDAFTIKDDNAAGTVKVDGSSTYTMSGILSNATGDTGAFAKAGTGTLVLSAANTYTGATTVSAGTLSLTGSLTSDITVAASGTLSGDGMTSGDLTVNGTFAPGDSVGTFSVAGDATIASGGTFSLDIDGRTYVAAGGSGTYDRLAITGASSTFTAGGAIAPITRNITAPATNTFTPIIGDAFRVVTTANASGVSGTFASITQPTTGIPTNTRFDVVYGASYVDLVLTPDNLATFVTANGGNQNTVRAATALQTVRPSAVAAKTGNSGAYWTGLYYLNAAQTLNALEQSSGQIHAYSLSAIRSSNVALARFDPAATLRADADEALWVLVGGDWLNFSEDTIASGFDSVSRNVWVGADLHNTGDRRYGVAIGYSDSDVSTDGMGSAQTDTSSIMAYYFGETGNWNYSGLVSMGFSDIKTQRTVALSTGTTDNASDSSAKTHIARLTVGYSQPVSETVSVGFNADVLRMHTAASGFTETGSAVTGLSATQENQAETQASLSLGLNWAPQNTNTVMGFNAGVEVRPGHDRISDRDVTLHSASWEVETPYMDGQLRFLEAGFRTTVGDLFNTDFEDADAYRINGNVRYTHQGIYERTSLVLGISRAF